MITRKSVLVVDNEQNFRRILEAKLLKYGFEVDITSNAADALRYLMMKTFAIVLLDLHLPDMDGIEALSRLKSAAPWTPFIAMSAYETAGIEENVWKVGGLETLYKPFDLDSLVRVIRSAISGDIEHPVNFTKAPFQTIFPDQIVQLGALKNMSESMVSARVLTTSPESFQILLNTAYPLMRKSIDIRMLGEDGLYEFTSNVMDISNDGLTWTIRKPSVIKRRQRRRHPRKAIAFPVSLLVADVSSNSEEIKGMGRDISLGGVALHSTTPLPNGSHVDIRWGNELSRAESLFTLSGSVVRVTDISHTDRMPIYQIAIEFDKLSSEVNKRLGSLIDSIQLSKPFHPVV